jgi:hypothetical protein
MSKFSAKQKNVSTGALILVIIAIPFISFASNSTIARSAASNTTPIAQAAVLQTVPSTSVTTKTPIVVNALATAATSAPFAEYATGYTYSYHPLPVNKTINLAAVALELLLLGIGLTTGIFERLGKAVIKRFRFATSA